MLPIWKGSPNCWKGREGDRTPVAIVNHIMVGTMESTLGWFNNPASQVSAHFGVAKDGRVWQFVSTNDTAWANGITESVDPSVPWLVNAVAYGVNPNLLTVSIEHEGNSGDVFPEAQYLATLGLHRLLIRDLKIKPDRQHIIGHYQIMKFEKANCPGPGFPWTRLMGDLALDSINDIGSSHQPTTFNPNPQGFKVGFGIFNKCKELGLTLIVGEQWFSPDAGQPGLGKMSRAWAQDSSGVTLVLMASEQPELAQPGQPIPWKVEVLQVK